MYSGPRTATASHWEDLDSDDIASVVSEDLYENRPNRWTGTKSTWRDLTAEERMLWRSMQQVVDRDLAVHLYDAFALKRQDLDPKTAEGLTVKTDNGHNAIWAPPKIWTAWPLQEKQVPREGLFPDTDGEDEAFTLRRTEKTLPSTDLQEELGATILRMAKQRFRRREQRRRRREQQQQQEQQQEQQKKRRTESYSLEPSIEMPSSPVSPRIKESDDECLLPSSPPGMEDSGSDHEGKGKLSWPSDDGIDDGGGDGDDEDEGRDNDSAAADTKRTTRDYEAAISTDDQLSQQLLRPSIRHILTQLDRTLTVLHNGRVAGLSYLFDSSDSSPEGDSDAATPRRKRGRPRRRENSKSAPSSEAEAEAAVAAAPPRRRRGRPRKVHEPQEGETLEEMQVRLARQSHRRLPWTAKDNEDAFEGWLQRGTMRQGQTQRQQQQEEEEPQSPSFSRTSASPSSQHVNKERKLRRWGLRDWSDVLGAASLAGFPPGVIARSTQRCASLFNQGMTMRTLDEQPLSKPGVFTTEYRPDEATSTRRNSLLSSSSTSSASASTSDSDDDNGDFDSNSEHSRRAQPHDPSPIRPSRGRGRGRGRTPRSSSPAGASRSQSRSRARSQSQSRSRSRSRSSAGLFLCPLQTCHRATDGFSRRANLRRHMQLVHPWHRGADEDEDDSENEVVGAVHTDGFLKMIHPGKGWRAEDTLVRKRKRFYGTRGGDGGEEDDGE